MNKTQILIIGAGPTGLTLACELARRNIKARIIDRSPEYPTGSRAKGLQPRSLEVFDDLGIAAKVIASGNGEVTFRRFDGNKLLGDIKPDIFHREDTRYMKGIMIPQWKIEEILREKLAEYNISVELATELTGFSQTETGVTATLKSPQGDEEFTCDYLIGCDGGKSTVRKGLGIKFEGETHEDERAFVGDVEVEGLIPDAWHIWSHPKFGFGFALCPFRCTNSWQLQTIAIPDEKGNLPEPTLELFNQIFQERTQMAQVTLKNATWKSIYRVNVRMADKYRVGRVFIAGDAAHVHSIAGGLGMNTGIQDAYNLGWKMAAVIQGHAKAALLDTYEEERLPIAAWTLNISSERHRAITKAVENGSGSFVNIATKDTTQLNLNYRYSSLSVDFTGKDGTLKAGDRAPDSEFADGSWLFDLYRGTHFTILSFGVTDKAVNHINEQFNWNVKAYHVTDKNVVAAFGNSDSLFVIRPDGYIGLIAEADDANAIINYLNKFLAD
jgi:2-polyprenyl-6-methoxyphenol hydroxylase-like FAD-dependent oxidoreductase